MHITSWAYHLQLHLWAVVHTNEGRFQVIYFGCLFLMSCCQSLMAFPMFLRDAGRGQDFTNLMEVNFTAESGTVRPASWNLKFHFAGLDIAWKSLLFICSLQKHWFNLHPPSTICTAVQRCLKSKVILQSPSTAAQGSETQHKGA